MTPRPAGSSALADYLMQRSVEENVAGKTLASLRHSSSSKSPAAAVTEPTLGTRMSRRGGLGPASSRPRSGDESDDSVLNEEEERLLDTLVANRQGALPGAKVPVSGRGYVPYTPSESMAPKTPKDFGAQTPKGPPPGSIGGTPRTLLDMPSSSRDDRVRFQVSTLSRIRGAQAEMN